MQNARRILAAFLAILLIVGPDLGYLPIQQASAQPSSVNPPRIGISLKPLVEQLLSETTDTNDADADGLPDSVEAVIGTDPDNEDSDFDRLNDYEEIMDYDLDPLEPDSNYDGLPDYLEINGGAPDADGDGVDNAWDLDNDGDGVNDGVDLSPFSKSTRQNDFHFDITTNARPLYVTFQIRPDNPDHLRLFGQMWDWPDGDSEGVMQDLNNSKEDVTLMPMLRLLVTEAPELNAEEKTNYGMTVEEDVEGDKDRVSLLLFPVTEHGNTVALTARLPYPAASPVNLEIDAELLWNVIGTTNAAEQPYEEQQTLLVTYQEAFTITGMLVEESYGADAGILYSDDLSQIVAANLLLPDLFLRTTDGHVTDMPDTLANANVDVDSQTRSFDNRDDALIWIAEQTRTALESLPSDQEVPVITLFEEQTVSVDLAELVDNALNAALPNAPETIKSLKTPWYNPSTYEELTTEEVMSAIATLDAWDDSETWENAAFFMMDMTLFWNTGETILVDSEAQDYDIVPDDIGDIIDGNLSALSVLYEAGKGYKALKFLKIKGWKIVRGIETLPELGKLSKFKTWVKQCGKVSDEVKAFKKMGKVMDGLDKATLFLDTVFGIVSIIRIAQSSDLSPIQMYTAIMETFLEYYLTVAEFVIGMIPVVGWALSLGICLSDLIGDWSGELVSWLADLMSDVTQQVTPSVDIIGDPSITIDQGENGLNVGDRIEYESRLKGTVEGNLSFWHGVQASSILPYYEVFAPKEYSFSIIPVITVGSLYSNTDNELPIPDAGEWETEEYEQAGSKSQAYQVGHWIEPGIAMPNFPVLFRLDAAYKLRYKWRFFVPIVVPPFYYGGFWCTQEDTAAGTLTGQSSSTLHFDVFPETLDDFVAWRSIEPLDRDGDGLKDTDEETASNPWLYDTDADGLSDAYEIEAGTDPQQYDTDGDGLIDWFELQYHSDPNDADSDDDGLPDYVEIAGWLIEFEYNGNSHTMRVYSDPGIPDTDGDGVEDLDEYWSALNPRSGDTNGDGTPDEPGANTIVLTWNEDFSVTFEIADGGKLKDMAVNSAGQCYLLSPSGSSSTNWLDVFDPDENRPLSPKEMVFQIDSTDYTADKIVIDEQHQSYFIHDGEYIRKFTSDWTGINWNSCDSGPFGDLEVDTDSHVYFFDTLYPGSLRIVAFDETGNWADDVQYIESSSGVEHFENICSLALNEEQGYLYVADADQQYIAKFGRNAYYDPYDDDSEYYLYHTEITTENLQNEGITLREGDVMAADAEGYLYVADADDNRLRLVMFDVNGMLVDDEEVSSPEGAANVRSAHVGTDPDGTHVYAAVAYDETSPGFKLTGVSLGDLIEFDGVPQGIVEALAASLQDTEFSNEEDFLNAVKDCIGDQDTATYEEQILSRARISIVLSNNVQLWKFSRTVEPAEEPVVVVDDGTLDSDGDGLSDLEEQNIGTSPTNPDTDSDGLSDLNEQTLGTDPTNPDTDGDGLNDSDDPNPTKPDTDDDGVIDGVEITFGSSLYAADSDGDGLWDSQELALNTDPTNPDSDGDGLSDGEEIEVNADPLAADSDGDLLFDGAEIAAGTDPNNSDSDDDGLSDGLETTYNTDPTNADTDGDGISDTDEIEMHLDPASSDTDGDGIPDGTEVEEGMNPWIETDNGDEDGDNVPNYADNCPLEPNPDQLDSDMDGTGDACDELPLTPSATYKITSADGGTVCLRSCAFSTYVAPWETDPEAIFVSVVIPDAGDIPLANEGWQLVSDVYDINVYDEQGDLLDFDQPVSLSFEYDPDDLNDAILEDSLTIHYYDSLAEQWMPIESEIDPDTYRVTGDSDHFSLWGLFGIAIPEPGTLILFGFGLLGLLAFGWRRRQRRK